MPGPAERITRAALLLVTTCALAAPADAQRPRVQGVHVALHGSGTAVQVPNDDPEHGWGYGGSVGYGISRFTLFAGGDAATLVAPYVDEISVLHGDVGMRVHFRTSAALVPYASVAFTRRIGKRDDLSLLGRRYDVKITGSGATLGGGVFYFLLPSMAAHLAATVTAGELDQLWLNGEKLRGCLIIICEGDSILEGSGRLALGLSWFPEF